MGTIKYKGKTYEADVIVVYNSCIQLTTSKGYYDQIILGGDGDSRFRISGEIVCHDLCVNNCLTFNGDINLCNVDNCLTCNGLIENLNYGRPNFCNPGKVIKSENERQKRFEEIYKLRRYNVVTLGGEFKSIQVPIFNKNTGGSSRSFLVSLKGKANIVRVGNCMTMTGGSIYNAVVGNQCFCDKNRVKNICSR